MKRTDLVEMENLGPVYYWQGVERPIRATRFRDPRTARIIETREPPETLEAEAWRELSLDAPPPPLELFWHPFDA